MPGPTTESLDQDLDKVVDRLGLVEVRTELRLLTGLAKITVGVVGTLLLSGIISGAWWAGFLSNRVQNLETKFVDVNVRFDKVDARFDKVDARFDNIDGRLDKADVRSEKIDGRLDKIDGRLDKTDVLLEKIDAKLDQLRKPLP